MNPGGQTSRLSLKRAEKEAGQFALSGGAEASGALFALSSLLSSHDKILEAFLDSSHTPSEKEALASSLTRGSSPVAAKLTALLCSLPWSRREDLAWATEKMGKDLLILGAAARGAAGKVREELEIFQQAASGYPLLDRCLSDKLSSGEKRRELCEKLIPEGFEEESRALAARCAQEGEGRYSSRLQEDIEAITACLGEAGIEVRSASPLSAGQAEALKDVFSKKLGRPVHLRQIEDPSLIGGFTVRCGAEVTDMSAGSQLRALKSAMEEKMAFCAKI